MASTESAQTTLVGVDVDHVTEEAVVGHILSSCAKGLGGRVYSVNLDILRLAHSSPWIRQMLASADLRIPDGIPVVWAAKIAGRPLPGRVPGSSLVPELCRQVAGTDLSVFLLGGNPGAADKAADVLRAAHPDLNIAGTHCPPFGFENSPEEMSLMRSRLRDASPDIIFVGLGFPKQERLIEALIEEDARSWYVSCGITFSFIAGELRRAPRWVQLAGLEWLHRFSQEPQRLFKRYFVEDIPFLVRLVAHAARSGRRRNAPLGE